MTLFSPILIDEIIKKYFNKKYISNYEYYSFTFFVALSELLNSIYNIDYYHNNCQYFLNCSKDINFEQLLSDFPQFLEFQPIILLIYKILEQVNSIDCYNIKIDDEILIEELLINNNFIFMNDLIKQIKNNNELDTLTKTIHFIKL
jgi:hypothetical protein